MSDGQRIPLLEAKQIASHLLVLLTPCADHVLVAGSIRRGVETVGDIELLAAPTLARQLDLFGVPTSTRNLLDEHCADLLAAGTLQQRLDTRGRPRWGTRYKAAV